MTNINHTNSCYRKQSDLHSKKKPNLCTPPKCYGNVMVLKLGQAYTCAYTSDAALCNTSSHFCLHRPPHAASMLPDCFKSHTYHHYQALVGRGSDYIWRRMRIWCLLAADAALWRGGGHVRILNYMQRQSTPRPPAIRQHVTMATQLQ